MFVKYSKGTAGVVEYLKLGVSKDRDFSRDEMDIRVTLEGNIEELDEVLKLYNKPKTIGDNYKHFVITFEQENMQLSDIKDITKEFKEFAMAGYKEDELYFYAEAHIPKLKGYPFMSGEYNHRKPHVHVIIPVYNLYTGNKGYNFNIGTFKYRKYLDLFSKSVNYRYNLNSPFEPENVKLFKSGANNIFRKTGREYRSNVLEFKKEVFDLIIKNQITTLNELAVVIKLTNKSVDKVKLGNINKNILIVSFLNHQKPIALRDYAFSREFLALNQEKKEFIYKKHIEKLDKNTIFINKDVINNKLTKEESSDLKNYYDLTAKFIKYSKIKPLVIEDLKNKDILQQYKGLKKLEKQFYGENNGSKFMFRNDETIRRTAKFNFERIQAEQQKYANNFELLSGRSRTNRGRIKSIMHVNVERKVLNKILEIKYGSNPSNQFHQNYNMLSSLQKSEVNRLVGENIKTLKFMTFSNNGDVSNFYNGKLNELLIDSYKIWLRLNHHKMKNPITGIEDKSKWDNIQKSIDERNKNKEQLENYKRERLRIEKEFFNRSKLKRKELKDLKQKYKDVLSFNKKILTKEIRQKLQIQKPSLRNNTIINDSYAQFLNNCLKNNRVIPQKNREDVNTYLKLVEICKLSDTKNNLTVVRDKIKLKDVENKIVENNLNISYNEYEDIDEILNRVEELMEEEIEIEKDKDKEHKTNIDIG